MSDSKRRYLNLNEEGKIETGGEYKDLLESIERREDPNSNTVLIVDDEPSIRKFVSRGIRRSNRTIVVYEAENGKDGLAKLAEIRSKYKNDPLLIITDLNMPVMDGWTFIEELRKDYVSRGETHGVPLIVLSSTSGEKGHAFFKKSVHKGKYEPMVSIAKEVCTDASKYTAKGEKGLRAWIKQFTEKQ